MASADRRWWSLFATRRQVTCRFGRRLRQSVYTRCWGWGTYANLFWQPSAALQRLQLIMFLSTRGVATRKKKKALSAIVSDRGSCCEIYRGLLSVKGCYHLRLHFHWRPVRYNWVFPIYSTGTHPWTLVKIRNSNWTLYYNHPARVGFLVGKLAR